MNPGRLRRLQWVVRATLTVGVAASVTANILHAQPNPISQAIAAWPPLALLLTVELVSRIPIVSRRLGVVRVVSTTVIAGIAAWVSYWHMVAVVARYGETGTVPYLLPASVDGLIVVASVTLVELAGRHHDQAHRRAPATATSVEPLPPSADEAPAQPPDSATAPTAHPNPNNGQADASSDQPDAVPDQTGIEVTNEAPAPPDPAPGSGPEPSPERNGNDDGADPNDPEHDDPDQDRAGDHNDGDLAPELVPLLPAARTARDQLIREGRTISRDALAHRLRRNGHAIRNNRVSELLTALRKEQSRSIPSTARAVH